MSYLDEICNNYIILEKELDKSRDLNKFARIVEDKYDILVKHLAEDIGGKAKRLRSIVVSGKLEHFFELVGDYNPFTNKTKPMIFTPDTNFLNNDALKEETTNYPQINLKKVEWETSCSSVMGHSFKKTLGLEKYFAFNNLFEGILYLSTDFAYLDLAEEAVEKRIEARDVTVIENMRKSFLEKYLN